MGGPQAAGMVTRLAHTAQLDAATLAAARDLMDVAFDGGFSDDDWEHSLGGMHALVLDGGVLVAHGSLVARRFLHDGRSVRCGYVEAVAVRPDRQGDGLGHRVMEQLETLAPAYDLLALSASDAGAALYVSRGWTQVGGQPPRSSLPRAWCAHPRTTTGCGCSAVSDVDGELTCDWRPATSGEGLLLT